MLCRPQYTIIYFLSHILRHPHNNWRGEVLNLTPHGIAFYSRIIPWSITTLLKFRHLTTYSKKKLFKFSFRNDTKQESRMSRKNIVILACISSNAGHMPPLKSRRLEPIKSSNTPLNCFCS